MFGQHHLYKNFWFGIGDNGQLPTIIFGCSIPKSDSGDPVMMRAVEVLVRHNPLLHLGPSQNLAKEEMSKVVYQKSLVPN